MLNRKKAKTMAARMAIMIDAYHVQGVGTDSAAALRIRAAT